MTDTYDRYVVYQGDDLGCCCSRERTAFRLWAPNAEQIVLRLYQEGDGGRPVRCMDMDKAENGTWTLELQGELSGMYYTYQVREAAGFLAETIDPYAKACGVNGKRGMILDLRTTDPEGFAEDRGPVIVSPVDIIVTETSVCDATADASSRVKRPGKFLGLAERGTRTPFGMTTGLDHLKELGVTHVQFMPMYDFASVDERKGNGYNWGYDPLNYNIPEGSYATDPYHGEVRIRECKQMIQAVHRLGMGVIMDVVYNHVYDVKLSSFQKVVPNYYFRTYRDAKTGDVRYHNASGCGNEIASERPMVRKYLIDSLCYWAEEYHIDGFRFDLMGVLDIETLNLAAEALRKIRPDIILYGEGWTGGTSGYPEEKRAMKFNCAKLDGYGMFSDDIRDHVKGHVFHSKSCGFANGAEGREDDIRFVIAAVRREILEGDIDAQRFRNAWALEPSQVINYVSCHDNLTLWDKLTLSCPKADEETKLAMNRLSASIVFSAQGIPFFLSGEEFARSKPIRGTGEVSENSYNKPVYTNALRYDRKEKYKELFEYYKGLIRFRKAHRALRLRSAEEIRNSITFLKGLPEQTVAYTIRTEQEELLVIYHAGEKAVEITLDEDAVWEVQVLDDIAGTEPIQRVKGSVTMPAIAALMAVRRE